LVAMTPRTKAKAESFRVPHGFEYTIRDEPEVSTHSVAGAAHGHNSECKTKGRRTGRANSTKQNTFKFCKQAQEVRFS
jgi:hypothetical protein